MYYFWSAEGARIPGHSALILFFRQQREIIQFITSPVQRALTLWLNKALCTHFAGLRYLFLFRPITFLIKENLNKQLSIKSSSRQPSFPQQYHGRGSKGRRGYYTSRGQIIKIQVSFHFYCKKHFNLNYRHSYCCND